jgi:hypothetical protein
MKKKIKEIKIKCKTNFNELSKEIYDFEKKRGYGKTSIAQLTKWLEEEVHNYKKAKSKIIKRNKLMDIICLTLQISRREGMSLDDAWKRWWWKARKYPIRH